MTALLEIKNLTKVFAPPGVFAGLFGKKTAGGIRALTNINLSVRQGEAVGIVGESGAGKTTLASLILGLERPTSGEVLVDGQRVLGGPHRRGQARRVQLVWQDAMAALDPRQKIEAALAEPLLIHGLVDHGEARERAGQLLKEVGLGDEMLGRYPHEISGGQAQRVVIARALALAPGIMICDEPASALDVQLKLQIADLLMRLRVERQLTYLVIAHDLPLVRKMTGSLAVMYRGRIVEQGATSTILQNPYHPYTQLLVSAEPAIGTDFLSASATARQANDIAQELDYAGCLFSHRCPRVIEHCYSEEVDLRVSGDRLVACLRCEGYSPT